MSERQSVPLYQRGTRIKIAGVEATLKAGDSADSASATWNIKAASISGITPRAGDRCRGTDGVWRTVREVAPLAAGAYPCLCDRDAEGES